VLVFVPIKYVYPSRTKVFRALNLSLAALWLVLYAVILADVPDPNALVVALSLGYVAYYLVASVYLTMLSPRTRALRAAARAGR
jgi:phosphatidylcholine synthase